MLQSEKSMKTSSSENDKCKSKINMNNADLVYTDDFSNCETQDIINDSMKSTFGTTIPISPHNVIPLLQSRKQQLWQ